MSNRRGVKREKKKRRSGVSENEGKTFLQGSLPVQRYIFSFYIKSKRKNDTSHVSRVHMHVGVSPLGTLLSLSLLRRVWSTERKKKWHCDTTEAIYKIGCVLLAWFGARQRIDQLYILYNVQRARERERGSPKESVAILSSDALYTHISTAMLVLCTSHPPASSKHLFAILHFIFSGLNFFFSPLCLWLYSRWLMGNPSWGFVPLVGLICIR